MSPVGYVYLMRQGERYKIGKSTDPLGRMRQVGHGPEPVELIHVIPSARPFAVENALHRRFAESRCDRPGLGREWFDLTAEDVEFICGLGPAVDIHNLPAKLRQLPAVPAARRVKERSSLRLLGAALKRTRESAGFTQSALAERAGVPLRTLVNYEQGHREPPSLAFFALLRAMGKTLSDFQPECDQLVPAAPSRGKAGSSRKPK